MKKEVKEVIAYAFGLTINYIKDQLTGWGRRNSFFKHEYSRVPDIYGMMKRGTFPMSFYDIINTGQTEKEPKNKLRLM